MRQTENFIGIDYGLSSQNRPKFLRGVRFHWAIIDSREEDKEYPLVNPDLIGTSGKRLRRKINGSQVVVFLHDGFRKGWTNIWLATGLQCSHGEKPFKGAPPLDDYGEHTHNGRR